MTRTRLTLLLLALATVGCAEPVELNNVVLISLDTVRRDHLPTYGYERNTAPTIDALAGEAVVFDNAYAQETNTNPSHTSMFTGLYPHAHGSLGNRWVLREGQRTLAGILRQAGFRTAGFVSGVVMSKPLTGLDRGFEVYDDQLTSDRRDGKETTRLALDWLAQRQSDERYFLFLHLYDAHGPYRPDDEYADQFVSEDPGPLVDVPRYQLTTNAEGKPNREQNGYIDRYDRQIRYLDDRVAEVLEAIDPRDTIVIVLADHGETLAERYHKFDHGAQTFDEQIRIPLIVRAPGFSSSRVAPIVETVDLLPTLLELLRVETPPNLPVQGGSLVPAMLGEPFSGKPFAFSAARANAYRHADRGLKLNPRRRIRSIRSADWKLIRYPGLRTDPLELYDLRADPGETSNVVAKHQDLLRSLMGELIAWENLATAKTGTPAQLDPDTEKKLRSLGYVD